MSVGMILIWIYVTGWFCYGVWFAISIYRSESLNGAEAKLRAKIDDEPDTVARTEAIAHWENNIHGIRTKIRIILPAVPIVFAFMIGSVWPLVLAIRIATTIASRGDP
jgi:hypothetical protein